MRIRKTAALGLFSTLMLSSLSCGGPPPGDEADVQIVVFAESSVPNVVNVKFNVSPAGEDVEFNAVSRINATGQAEVDITVTSGGVPKVPDIPQIILAEADSGCIGCPEDTTGTGSHTEVGMTPGHGYTIPLAIHYPGKGPSASAAINLTLDSEPGAESAYVLPGQQTEGGSVIVAVEPTNPEGPVTDLELTAEFEAVSGSKVTLLDDDGDGFYVNGLTAPAAGSHTLVITIVNTVTGGTTEITHPYVTVP
jgi:hypothetical protein